MSQYILLVLLLGCMQIVAQESEYDQSLLQIGSENSINMAAAEPLRDIAHLLVQADRDISRLNGNPFTASNIVHHHIEVERRDHIVPLKVIEPTRQLAGHVNAELIPRLRQPTIHDPKRWGTRHPVYPNKEMVDAMIVGEDGKPYIPRKSTGVEQDPDDASHRSPFAKYVFPPGVGAAADVENADNNIKLTPLELKKVNRLQKRLKIMLDQLGSNIVFDHSVVKNRRYVKEYDKLKSEARALMEEYELRTGVKTIAWTMAEPGEAGLVAPRPKISDIFFSKQKHLATRQLQRSSGAFPVKPDEPKLPAQLPPGPNIRQRIDLKLGRTKSGQMVADVTLKLHEKPIKKKPFKNYHPRPNAPLTISVKGVKKEKVVRGRLFEAKDPNAPKPKRLKLKKVIKREDD